MFDDAQQSLAGMYCIRLTINIQPMVEWIQPYRYLKLISESLHRIHVTMLNNIFFSIFYSGFLLQLLSQYYFISPDECIIKYEEPNFVSSWQLAII